MKMDQKDRLDMDIKCKGCGKKLVPFRKITKGDWPTRQYHTKCWNKRTNVVEHSVDTESLRHYRCHYCKTKYGADKERAKQCHLKCRSDNNHSVFITYC
jgi:hypothetical protein